RAWDLDRTSGGLMVLHPSQGNEGAEGFQSGTAEVVHSNASLIREFAPQALVVVSADAVYKLDYGALVDEHMQTGADVTMVTTEVEPDDAGRYGVVQAAGGRVRDYVYKPDEPEGNVIANEVFVFAPEPLLGTLDGLAEEDGELEDLGHRLLPRLVDAGNVREHRFVDYWRDVGTIPAYWQAHAELTGDEPPIDLDDPGWPILTHATSHRASAQVLVGADLDRVLLAPGSRVAGTVERSVIGRGAVVEAGATVRDAVVLPGAVVRSGATVERAVLDQAVDVRADVGAAGGEIALVGVEATVDAPVPAGGRYPQEDDAQR
ncbi:MAG TPA: sugar phosphate nucleotidyltransferase, partial [Solirubrobacteraceae bacterium]|nr:sugar phosphate nucleotidyltransferase [Solirubrobacteraceae bacterium]